MYPIFWTPLSHFPGVSSNFEKFRSSVGDIERIFQIKNLQKEITILYRLERNLFHGISLLRLIDDTLGRVVDILFQIKALLVEAAGKDDLEREIIQNQINERVRNIAQLLEGFSYDGFNPFKGDKIVIHYGNGAGDYLILNGRSLNDDGSELVIKAEAPENDGEASRIKIWNRYYWRGVRRFGVALWANDGGENYRLTLQPPPNYIGIPPRVLFPGDPPFYWPPYVNRLVVVEFVFYTATEEAVQNSIEDVEKAIKTFDKIRGFYAAALNKLQNLLEFQQLKRANFQEPLDRIELSETLGRLIYTLYWKLKTNLSLTVEIQKIDHF